MSRQRNSGRQRRSALWLAIHGWLGLPLWAFLFFVCLTGSIATVSEEIIWLIHPAARSNPPSAEAVRPGYDALTARIEEQRPGSVVMYIDIPVKEQYALQFYVGRPDGGEGVIYVNPYTGRVQGEKSAFDLREMLRALHGWLLIPFTGRYSVGWYLVSALALPLFVSLVTGLLVYKKFWRAYLRPRLRVRQGARVFWGDFHRLVGLWSFPFVAIMSVTAMWFLIQAILEDTGYKLPGEIEHPHVARRNVPLGSGRDAVQTVTVDKAIEIARTRFPGLAPAFIELPMSAYDPIEVWGRSAYPLIFEIAYIDPFSGRVLVTQGIHDRSTVALVTESMRPLHTGDFAGLWLKLVYFAFGLLLTSMSLSGMLIWAKRSLQATRTAIGRPRPEPATAFANSAALK